MFTAVQFFCSCWLVLIAPPIWRASANDHCPDGNFVGCFIDDDCPLLTSPPSGPATVSFRQTCNGHELGTITIDSPFSKANFSVECYNSSNHQVYYIIEDRGIGKDGESVRVPEDITAVNCVFQGCYHEQGYRIGLNQESCYIDQDECANDTTNNCDGNANCTNILTGNYSCECKAGYVGSGSECYAEVYPSIISDQTEVDAIIGEKLTLSVSISYAVNDYLPLTNISWTHDGNSSLNVSHDHILPTLELPLNSTLYFSSISTDDAGIYNVTATNSAGSSHAYTFHLTVVEPAVCADNSCDSNAICTSNLNGTYSCECNNGYVADGQVCYPEEKNIGEVKSYTIIMAIVVSSTLLLIVIVCLSLLRHYWFGERKKKMMIDVHRGYWMDVGQNNFSDKNSVLECPPSLHTSNNNDDEHSVYEYLYTDDQTRLNTIGETDVLQTRVDNVSDSECSEEPQLCFPASQPHQDDSNDNINSGGYVHNESWSGDEPRATSSSISIHLDQQETWSDADQLSYMHNDHEDTSSSYVFELSPPQILDLNPEVRTSHNNTSDREYNECTQEQKIFYTYSDSTDYVQGF